MAPRMKAERWRQIETLFHAAREREPGERAAFLYEACAGDEELRREVDSLLSEHERGGSVLGEVTSDLAAEWVQEQERPTIALGHFRILSLLGKGGMGELVTPLRARSACRLRAQSSEHRDHLRDWPCG